MTSENIESTHFRDRAQVNQAVLARLAPRSVFQRNENGLGGGWNGHSVSIA